jgi:ribosomal protein L7/L12
MFTVTERALAELVKVLDWNDVIQQLYAKSPAVVADLLNDIYQDVPQDEDNTDSVNLYEAQKRLVPDRLQDTFFYVKEAVRNSKMDCGRLVVATSDKIRAIKALRTEFNTTLKFAKDSVEMMMDELHRDANYIPSFIYRNHVVYFS